MLTPGKWLIPSLVTALCWGGRARAEDTTPAKAPDKTANATAAATADATPASATDPGGDPTSVTEQVNPSTDTTALSDEELLKQSEAETIEIFDERPDKPFDRDTEVRLTGEQLAARGAVDLGTALALLPDVTVRDAGRGGFNIDIRGARKGAVSVLSMACS